MDKMILVHMVGDERRETCIESIFPTYSFLDNVDALLGKTSNIVVTGFKYWWTHHFTGETMFGHVKLSDFKGVIEDDGVIETKDASEVIDNGRK